MVIMDERRSKMDGVGCFMACKSWSMQLIGLKLVGRH